MKKSVFLLFLSLSLFATHLPSQECTEAECNSLGSSLADYWGICDSFLELTNGYRADHFVWSIQGFRGVPNILSELTYKDLNIYQIGLTGYVLTDCHLYLRGNVDYGWILDGHFQDSDFDGSDRTLETDRSIGASNGDAVYDATIGIGYLFDMENCSSCFSGLSIAPIAGYSYHHQKFRMTHGNALIDEGGFLGPYPGLNSTYTAKWNSGWIGVDLGYQYNCDWWLFANYEHHWISYRGTGHWNLRTEFIGDFNQKANGDNGNVLNAGVKYVLCGNWMLGLTGNYQFWKTNQGIHELTVLTEENFIVPARTVLNPVTWRSYAVTLDLGYLF